MSREDDRRESSEDASGDAVSRADDGPAEIVDSVSGTGIPVRGNDIDTDQIIPARFMKVVTFDGLGEFAFFDQRFDSEDNEKEHPFNEGQYQGANVLVVNSNFGCGSSREHAPQALQRWGIDAIVGESFAEIFAGNCLALGIPTVTASTEEIGALQAYVEENPDTEISVDVDRELVTYGSGDEETAINGDVAAAQHKALVEGVWDTTALMKANANAVRETADSLPYMQSDD
ncbi:3-isopropylmalate dehydratase small subunit [Halalkalicoccus jeotgali]|uniref:3-isopropylmalate dehydratase n=1 Tax=Halalkalicoccus jeotgali (strain DSM 18796 / CECT 7217 / JCM 14584 / KCTC 4019 / B3) TaxID=795797 RepID=D8J4M1_HALJB|nr:3-isopropylmalate dehydratase small subunit [Halalkalicoccus jeotgali]ADJ15488.1 3-isopropylmalate dehydratase, small subunit [Halalkalicoccus jeotgali B3]ELY36103.1 3-isopropylmalate dehydratase, small subunit [Halalkalicoccus jeotgali B3]